jgi:DNA repair protein RadA/Sms
MARSTTRFVCRTCGAIHARWYGKCPDCGAWDALEEHREAGGAAMDRQRGSAAVSRPDGANTAAAAPIGSIEMPREPRLSTHIDELDRVLGGHDGRRGIVQGSAVLLGGDPGIGKSTLLLQAAETLARRQHRVLYVTSEESAHQTQMRAQRLNVTADELYVLAETNLARIIEQVRQVEPAVVVIDSIQMIYKGELEAAPGTVAQLRACGTELVYLAKAAGVAVVLVGHVTKEGTLAGPRLLEHLVDCVLYFEGDRYHSHRLVRAIKNRFGTTQEVGIFEMTGEGLQQVGDPSQLVAAEYNQQASPRPGSVICPVMQGSRCLMVEVQALTATSFLGAAKRRTSGIDPNRLAMLVAVLEKRGGLRLADQDVFVSVVGGLKIVEPAADLAVALAIAGAHLEKPLGDIRCAVGEIGLGGELRAVNQSELRLREATRLGFGRIATSRLPKTMPVPAGCEPLCIESLDEALQLLG